MDKPDVDAVPKFVLANKTYRAVVGTSDKPIEKRTPKNSKEAPIGDSTLIVSKTPQGNHKPMIDLDFEVAVLPSSTSGHNHLYINKDLTDSQYEKLLTTMVEVGLVQPGVLEGFKKNKETSLRLPGVKKGGDFEQKVKSEFDSANSNKPVALHWSNPASNLLTLTDTNANTLSATVSAFSGNHAQVAPKVTAEEVKEQLLKFQFELNAKIDKFSASMLTLKQEMYAVQNQLFALKVSVSDLEKKAKSDVDKTNPTW